MWVRYPLPAQHTTAPTSIAKYFACILHSSLRFAVCFPEDTKHLLAGGVLYWPEIPCTVQERGQLLQTTAGILGVNPVATFVIGAHQNRSLPKLTCCLCSSAWILFILSGTEKPKTTTSDKPVYCIIYLDSNVEKSNRPTSLSPVSNSSLYSREPGMLNAQDLRLRTYKRFTSYPSYNY